MTPYPKQLESPRCGVEDEFNGQRLVCLLHRRHAGEHQWALASETNR